MLGGSHRTWLAHAAEAMAVIAAETIADAETMEVDFAHPTLGEAVKEAIHGRAGHVINF